MVINCSTTELPLTVSYGKISGMLCFWIHTQDAMYSLQQLEFSEKEADEMKGIFVVTYSESERKTEEYETQAMNYLSYLLYPLCIRGAVCLLLNIKYKSCCSWLINSFVNGVYSFGFFFMMPWLFVNYRMKSVAHLPRKTFTYKAFNIFIDDDFAFIITMPTSHELACFRDNVVFLVDLYQQWLCLVDKSRLNEFCKSYKKPQWKPAAD
ncbi:hypothetical protein HPG69_006257 [Diceros bicornis minor]|uniref:Lipid scramblase CLPTM1L n=1 Tax=Diceros bicornis minor TaxID=77932 RepID=A0A7J7EYU0_DICBM|nr:hypothetical protein HPG69_006257 [Diceros bicornis minor]